MPKLSVNQTTDQDPQTVFNKVSSLLQNDASLKKLDPSYACEFDAKTLSGQASGKMFKAKMDIKPSGTGSVVNIEVELPFALSLAKGMVQKTLQGKLDQVLG